METEKEIIGGDMSDMKAIIEKLEKADALANRTEWLGKFMAEALEESNIAAGELSLQIVDNIFHVGKMITEALRMLDNEMKQRAEESP